jgi:hypothetical protein
LVKEQRLIGHFDHKLENGFPDGDSSFFDSREDFFMTRENAGMANWVAMDSVEVGAGRGASEIDASVDRFGRLLVGYNGAVGVEV